MRKVQHFPVIIILTILLSGCRGVGGGGGGGSIELTGFPEDAVRYTTMSVFHDNGYKLMGGQGNEMVFEKEGTGTDVAAYGGWFDKEVWIRVRATIIPLSSESHRIVCETSIVRDKGKRGIEEEQRTLRRRATQALLDEVKQRLATN